MTSCTKQMSWTKRATTLGTIGAIGIIGLLTTFSGTAIAANNEPGIVATQVTLNASPSSIWDAAIKGDSAALDSLLNPNNWDQSTIDADLFASIELLSSNIVKREATREEQITDANTRLLEHLESYDETNSGVHLSKALAASVELQMLFNDDDKFFTDASVSKAINISIKAAKIAEDSGDWMIASELYYRLNAIHDPSGIYKKDVKRLSRRLAMIRMYAPERLWEIRNQRRIDEEMDPLPPYNAYGDDFHEKLKGINSITVRTAIQRSADQHVGRKTRKHPNGVNMNDLILSGINAIETMATTTDLAVAFDGLEKETNRNKFLDVIHAQQAKIKAKEHTASGYDLRRALDSILIAGQQFVGIQESALLHEFGNGAMSALDDYTAIIWPDELARFRRSTQGEFIGIGVQIQLDEFQNIKIVTPLEGTPAQRAGVQSNDIIKKIDGITAVGLGLNQAVDIITGPANTKVVITVEREITGGEIIEKEFVIIRQKIDLPSVKGWSKTGAGDQDWNYFIDQDAGIGYLRLTGFTQDSTKEFDRAVKAMKNEGLNALILDLRYNPGGLLDQAVNLASRFMPSGMVVKTVDGSGVTNWIGEAKRVSARQSIADIPVVVLVNEGSASASEILSGAIQASAHQGKTQALVLGHRSFGKGSVQNVYLLPGGSAAMKVTTNYYKIDAPRMIHKVPGATEWGIDPDLIVDMLPSQQAEALLLRRSADVLPLDENGNIIVDAERPDPNTLITDGTDLQVQTALVLLQSQTTVDNTKTTMMD
ncbi:MAG: S41 family peptidase [Phycisphaerales bacterium]|nr:S41 family peptidase [Phycisphaerales bacterium]